MDRINYSKVDPWIKKNPQGKYEDFVNANPKFEISSWSFRKQRAKVLGLKLTPSMVSGYRSKKAGAEGGDEDGIVLDRRSRSLYNTVYSTPMADLKKKNGIEAASEIIAAMNRIFKLHLESAQVEVIGTGVQNFEIRRYGR
jgi:predicted transcriptional regulator